MPPAIRAAAVSLLLSLALPATAQQAVEPYFTPNPAPAGANVRMYFELPRNGCGETAYPTISRNGFAIRVDYTLSAPFICGVPPPTTAVIVDLGAFPPGNYTVTAVGVDYPPGPLPVVNGAFVVVQATSGVPSLSLPGALALALSAMLVGTTVLVRRR